MPNVAMMGWDADAKLWRKVLVNAEGKLIIDPSEIFEDPPTEDEMGKAPQSKWAFDHNANASAHHTKYTDVEARIALGYNVTRYWSCGGGQFDGSSPDIDDITKDGEGNLIVNTNGIVLRGPVFLPNGCMVTKAIVYGNAGSEDTVWYLRRVKLTDKTVVNLAYNYINSQTDVTEYATIDNSSYAYFFYTAALNASNEVYGARITYGVVLGSELVTNGDFTSSAGWGILGTGFSIAGGKLIGVNATNASFIYRALVLTAGKHYRLSVYVDSVSAGSFSAYWGASILYISIPGFFYLDFIASASDNYIYIQGYTSFTGIIDYVSIKEIFNY